MSELPLMLEMQLHLTTEAHKQELADKFAELRKRLIPPPPPPSAWALQNMLLNAARQKDYFNTPAYQNALAPCLPMPLSGSYYQNALAAQGSGLGLGSILGLQMP